MDDDCCELLRCCCECGLCIGLCCLCCKDSGTNQNQFSHGQGNVTVTSQPVPQQPYPTHGGPPPGGLYGAPSYPPSMPQPGYPPHNPYPSAGGAPYPPAGGAPYPPAGGAPYPPASGAPYPPGGPNMAPYPPTGGYQPNPGYQNHPPPYDIAVGQPPNQPPGPIREEYGKQSPFNPNYHS